MSLELGHGIHIYTYARAKDLLHVVQVNGFSRVSILCVSQMLLQCRWISRTQESVGSNIRDR